MNTYEPYITIPIHGYDDQYGESVTQTRGQICNLIVITLLAVSVGELIIILLILLL